MNNKIYDILRKMGVLPDVRKVNQHETTQIIGVPSIYKKYADGSMDLIFTEENLITTASKKALLTYIYETATVDPVTQLKIGTGGCQDSNGQFPKPEDAGATDLVTPVLTVPVTYTLGASDVSVTFLADIDQGSANNLLITEAGLFKASNAIFNVKNFPGIPKTSDFAIHFQWLVKYA